MAEGGEKSIYLVKDCFRLTVKRPYINSQEEKRALFVTTLKTWPLDPEFPEDELDSSTDKDKPMLIEIFRKYLNESDEVFPNKTSDFMSFRPHSLASDGKVVYEVGLSSAFIKWSCSNIPSPSLKLDIRVQEVDDENVRASIPLILAKRFRLNDYLLETESAVPEEWILRNVKNPDGKPFFVLFRDRICLEFSVEISLGWNGDVQSFPGVSQDGVEFSSKSILLSLFGMESSKDLTIVAGNGAELKCHRIIFTAHSPVLERMLSPENGMLESQTGRILMKGNSEDGVNLLLRYLYGLKITNAELTSDIAVELFKTAHQYELSQLQAHLLDLFSTRDEGWFKDNPKDILELYFHVRNVDGLEALKDRILRIMANMPQQLKSCERFKELDREEAESLMWSMMENK